MSEAPPLVCIMGPTGVGKTQLAERLAATWPVEIVSVDSAQIYRGLDIGTAKPNPAERRRVAYHLIDICEPTERYSAARFSADAAAAVAAIRARGHLPLLVGGTGLYFRAFEQGLAALPDGDAATRGRLEAALAAEGGAALHARLARVDPAAAARIHPNDPQRLVRALEVFELTGRPLTELWTDQAPAPPPRRLLKIALTPPSRAQLHARIARRFGDMLERGLVNEVRALRRRGDLDADLPAMRSVGYRDVWRFLDGSIDYDEMVAAGTARTRQLAKRQITWLRREPGCEWFEPGDPALEQRLRELLPHPGDFQTAPI